MGEIYHFWNSRGTELRDLEGSGCAPRTSVPAALNMNTVDLNLFLVFRAIYSTGSVTQAGDQVCMTQSAASNALKRLRERFNDELFFRTPKGMVPTPMANQLIELVEEGLAKFNQALDRVRRFDPDSSNRLFRIAMNDIGQLVFMPSLLSAARSAAPSVRIETIGASPDEVRELLLDGKIDLALGSWRHMGKGFREQRLFNETLVAVMNISHPIQSRQLTCEEYFAAEHLAYRPSGASDTALQAALAEGKMLGRRKVVLTAAHSMGLSAILAGSNLVLTVPSRLAQAMVGARPELRIARLPFSVRPFPIGQQWHDRNHSDAGNAWLRRLTQDLFHDKPVQDIAREVV